MEIDTGNVDVYLNSSSNDTQSFGILNADTITAQFQQIYVSGLTLNNTALFQLSCNQAQSALFYSSLDISSSNFTNLTLTSSMLIWLTSTNLNSTQLCGVFISVENSNFSVISSAVSDWAIFLSESSQFVGMGPNKALLSLVQSRFNTISSQRGSIYFGQALKGFSSILFDRCEFIGIKASQEGGIFYVTNASNGSYSTTPSTNSRRRRALGSMATTQNYILEYYNIFSSNFSTISAQNGGVFYGDYTNNGNSTIILQNNSFYNIQSVSRGGILFVYDSNLQIKYNNFTNISAIITGSIVYSYAANLNPYNLQSLNHFTSVYDLSPLAFAPNTLQIQLQSTGFAQASYEQDPATSNTYLVLTNTSSFSLENLILSITLYYHNEQISQALTDNTLIGSVNLAFALGNSQTKNFPSPCYDSVCTVQPSTINLVGNEGFITDVTVTYTSQNVNYLISTKFQIVLRGCVMGEINSTVGLACTVCESGKYSLNASDKACKPCLEYATCYGGTNISLNQGYWRRDNQSENIIECEGGAQRCNGGFDSSCTKQYTGPVCLQCNTALGYIANNEGDCSLCSAENYVVGVGVSVLVISIAYQIYVFYSTYRDSVKTYQENQIPAADSSENSTPKPGAYITILTTYAQVSSLFSKWIVDGVTSNTFDFSNTLGNSYQLILSSLQCFLFYTMQDPFEILRLRVVVFTLSPLVKLTVISLFLIIRAVVTKEENKKQRLQMRIGVVVVGLITLEQPGIVGVLCDYLSCITLDPSDETVYVATNPNVQCGTDDYNFFRNFFVIPAIVIWGFLISITLMWILYSKRKKLLQSERFYVIFGVLYNSYVLKAYYWGVITVSFKLLLYFLNSMLVFSSLARALVIILVIHIYHMAYLRVSPRIYPDLTKADGYIIRSFKWSIILILLRDAATETSIQVLTEVLIIIVNALPVGYIIFRLLAIYLSIYTPKICNRLKKCLKRSIEEKSPKKEEPLPINSDMIVISAVDAHSPIESELNHFTHVDLNQKASSDAELKIELKDVESEANLESVRPRNEHYAESPENDIEVSKDAELKIELKNVGSESNLESVRPLNEDYAESPENVMEILDLVHYEENYFSKEKY